MAEQTVETSRQADVPQGALNGVVIGMLVGFDEQRRPLVVYPGNPSEKAIVARTTATLSEEHIGKEVALLFEAGDPLSPIVIGPIQHPAVPESSTARQPWSADVDGQRILLSAKKEIVLQCGKASITLTKAGKVLIRGAYLLNRSSGVNRIKGGSVQIN